MVESLVTRYGVVDTESAIYDGIAPSLMLFDKVVVSGLPGIRHGLNDIDNPDPLAERPRFRPAVIRRLMLERLTRAGREPLDEPRLRSFFADCEYLIANGAMTEPRVENI